MMTVSYVTRIDQLTAFPTLGDKTDVVERVLWTLVGTQNGETGEWSSMTEIPFDPNAQFIPYTDLTPDTVLGWITQYTSASYINEAKASIEAQMSAPTPPAPMPLPW